MANAQILNIGPTREENSQDPKQAVAAEELSRDVRRLRTQMERQEEEYETHGKRTKVLSVVLGALLVIFAVSMWFVYPMVLEEKKGLADILNLQNVSAALIGHVSSVEEKVNKMKADLPVLSQRMDKVQANMKANLQVVRNQVNRSLQAMETRLSGLESNQRESSERVIKLQEEVAGLQRELAAMRQKESAAEDKSSEAKPTTEDNNADLPAPAPH